MKGWTGKEYGFYIGSVVLIYVVTRGASLLCGMLMAPALLSMAVFALLPCLGAFLVTYRLRTQNKSAWLTIAVPAVLDLLWIVMSLDLSTSAKLVSKLTGHYNIEAIGFFLLFAILFCSGLLVGAFLGSLLSPRQK